MPEEKYYSTIFISSRKLKISVSERTYKAYLKVIAGDKRASLLQHIINYGSI
jgi:hypothetical protein